MNNRKNGEEGLDPRLQRVYSSPGDKRKLFDHWANTYDHDLVHELGYVADAEACRYLVERIADPGGRILDAGCGTGLVGRRLFNAGYHELHGSDFSAEMLEQAAKTGVYKTLKQHDLTCPLPGTMQFDAVIAVGVFAFNVPNASHLVHLTRVLAPDGLAFVTVNGKAWVEMEWERQIREFEADIAETRLLEVIPIDYLVRENIDGRLLILQRVP